MATIQKRPGRQGKPSFRVQIRLKGAPVETASFESRTAAKRWAQSTEAAIRENRHFRTSEARRRTVADLIDRYVEQWLPQKPSSFVTQRFQLLWWREEIGCRVLAELRPDTFIDARTKLAKRQVLKKNEKGETVKVKIAPGTVNRYFAALSPVFAIAVRELGWLHENPMNGIVKLREPRGRTRFLDMTEIERLYKACKDSSNPYIYPFVILAMSTGMRKNEMLRLRWRDLDRDLQQVVLHNTKNGEKRSVPLATKVFNELLRLRKTAAQSLQAGIGSDTELDTKHIFPGRSGHQPLDIRVPWENVRAAAKLRDFKIHDLRHTAASYLAMNGSSPLDIAHILGHKSLEMVKRYAHLSPQHTASVIQSLTKRLGI